ncbi:hypothetical protein AMTRI_Chr04g183920 [Amborella trichopoda]
MGLLSSLVLRSVPLALSCHATRSIKESKDWGISPWLKKVLYSEATFFKAMEILAGSAFMAPKKDKAISKASGRLLMRGSTIKHTFFLPTIETTPTLEDVIRIFGLNLVEIAYQPSTATDDHSIMGARLLAATYSSHVGYINVSIVLTGIYHGLHDKVMRGDRFIEGSVMILQIWAYEHIYIVRPPRSTTIVFVALGLAYVNNTTRPRDVNYYRRILDELSSFDWVIRGLENVSLFLPAMGHSCLILAGQFFTKGYFLQRILRQFGHTQNYTSPEEAIDRCPIFSLRRHSSTLLIKAGLSWKGKKSSSREGLVKQDMPTTTSNYDSWWKRASPLLLCPRSSRLRDEPSTLAQDLMPPREDGASCSNKRIKFNEDVSDISLEEAEVELARWMAFVADSRGRMLIRNRRLNSQNIFLSLFFSLA